ncbi:transmembrane protein, putative, partial (macronuclear) [Tetrahymena thermophila SB210]
FLFYFLFYLHSFYPSQFNSIFIFTFFSYFIRFLLFHIFSSFFPSKQLSTYLQFQYLKSWNQIGNEGTSDLSSALSNCTNLSNLTLDLMGNEIDSIGASYLGSALANCTNLLNLEINL